MKQINKASQHQSKLAIAIKRNYHILFCTEDLDVFVNEISFYPKSGKVANNVGIISTQLKSKLQYYKGKSYTIIIRNKFPNNKKLQAQIQQILKDSQ